MYKGPKWYFWFDAGGNHNFIKIVDKAGWHRMNEAYSVHNQSPPGWADSPGGTVITGGKAKIEKFMRKPGQNRWAMRVYEGRQGEEQWAKDHPEKAKKIMSEMGRSRGRKPTRQTTNDVRGYGGYVSGVRGGIGSHLPQGAMWPTGGPALFDPQNRGYGPRW